MKHLAAFALAGCYTSSVPAPPVEHVPEVHFALADGADVRIVRTSDSGLVVERTLAMPSHVSRIMYAGPQLAVWLAELPPGHMRGGFEMPDDQPDPHENEMGIVTDAGYQKLAPLAWPPVPKESVAEFADMATAVDQTTLFATDGELWQAHCAWYGGPDGGWCLHATYARRFPAPVVFVDKEPKLPRELALPKVKAPASLRVEVKDLPKGEDKAAWEPPHRVLECSTAGGEPTVYPPEDKRDGERAVEVTWLSHDPPIFLAKLAPDWAGVGAPPPPVFRVFERCAPSQRYTNAFAGPHDIAVIAGDEVSVRWRGREIGRLARGGSVIAFRRP